MVDWLMAANRQTTQSSYQSAWRGWCNWCIRGGADPKSPSVNEILSYLSGIFSACKSYSTITVHKSMLSSTLTLLEGREVGRHPLVMALMRGIYNSAPPRPRYSSTWDVHQVLNYFSERHNASLVFGRSVYQGGYTNSSGYDDALLRNIIDLYLFGKIRTVRDLV